MVARHYAVTLQFIQSIPQYTAESPFRGRVYQGFSCPKFLYAAIDLIQMLQFIFRPPGQDYNFDLAVSFKLFDKIGR